MGKEGEFAFQLGDFYTGLKFALCMFSAGGGKDPLDSCAGTCPALNPGVKLVTSVWVDQRIQEEIGMRGATWM